uniref:Upstream transcription factor 2, c-fos interacting n=1 Tax=Cynoglossus semilaevis TaxID=244447 RepID=A0A3P8UFC1_CYNSE
MYSQEKQEEVEEEVEGPEEQQEDVSISSFHQSAAFPENNVQYQFHSEGQVTYHVVQVTEEHLEGRREGGRAGGGAVSVAFSAAPQAVAQAVIQNSYSNGGSPAGDATGGETRFAYYPASKAATAVVSEGSVSLQTGTGSGSGQLYVMMAPSNVTQTGTTRSIAPQTPSYSVKMDGTRAPRDDRRRAQHNEVERRRRDRINNWIVTLSNIIPGCSVDSTKTGASKGGILSKACDYIRELRQSNQRLQESFKEVERIQVENQMCQQQIEELKSENVLLRAQLQQHGIEAHATTTQQC